MIYLRTKPFVDTMYSLNLYPLINKQTGVARVTSTLIENMLSNAINKQTTSGILITDITYHVSVYTLFQYEVTRTNQQSKRYSRSLKRENINSL